MCSSFNVGLAFSEKLDAFVWVDHMVDGNDFYKSGKFKQAVGAYQKAIGEKANLWDAWFQLGQCYERMAERSKEDSASLYRKALSSYKKVPSSKTEFFEKVRFYRKKVAEILYGNIHPVDINDLRWVYSLKKAKNALLKKDYDSAISLFHHVADEKPEMYDIYMSLGYAYEKKAEKARLIEDKVKLFDKAILEYRKVPRKNPGFVHNMMDIKKRLRSRYMTFYDFKIKLGENRSDIVAKLGPLKKGQEKVSLVHFPKGSVKKIRYDQIGVQFRLREDKIFSIKFGSNYNGTVYGIKINNTIEKIRFLYDTEPVAVPGSFKGYKVEELGVLFIFNDTDNMVDMLEVYDPKLYGQWNMRLK